jgi:hypothetical protein
MVKNVVDYCDWRRDGRSVAVELNEDHVTRVGKLQHLPQEKEAVNETTATAVSHTLLQSISILLRYTTDRLDYR